MRAVAILLLALAALLGGCAGMRIVDSDVRTFAGAEPLPPIQGLRYRIERLPSQQAQPAATGALEAMAHAALERVGLRRDDAAAQLSVQITLTQYRDPQAPWDDPRYVLGHYRPMVVTTPEGLMFLHPAPDLMLPHYWYRRELRLLMRRVADARVLYEVHVQHDGRWADTANVLPAMFQAALDGFPQPGQTVRRVVVEIPR